ncbi:AraC-type DNA-binding protein [bacterium A37T11]|nr:AraC-type DNA-binding protein [bacterium A37T11]
MDNEKMERGLGEALIFIRRLENCPPSYLYDPERKEFFEIVWLRDEDALHEVKDKQVALHGDWIYLIPPYRVHQLNKAGKKGVIISFKREMLDDDVKEFLLDVFRIFNLQGEFSCLKADDSMSVELDQVYQLLEAEYLRDAHSLIMLKALLKVFLLKLIRLKEAAFTVQDINEKRIYEFMMLLEMNYHQERNTDFYAGKLRVSSKRLNQVLKEKLNKTGMQLIHDRIILEAKRQIIHSESTIKEIAYDLGFNDRPYFSRFFKQHTGLSPEQFQKSVREHISTKSNTLVI